MGKNEIVEIFNGDMWQAQVIEGLLKSNGIGCYLKDKNLPGIIPAYGPMGNVAVCIMAENEERAKEVIANKSEEQSH